MIRYAVAFGLLLLPLPSGCSSGDSSSGPPADAATSDGASDAGLDGDSSVSDTGVGDAADAGATILSLPSSGIFEAETHLVEAPGGRSLAVWMTLGASADINGYAVSEDQGASWSKPQLLTGKPSKGDPVATFGSDGSLYYGFLDGICDTQGCSKGHVWIARMPPGSKTFEPAVDASPADPTEFYDKPWLMTAADGTLVLVVNARVGLNPTNVDRIVVARSTDGKSWSQTDAVPKLPLGQIAGIPHACISRQGSRMWIAYVDSSTATYSSLRWSDDLGQTWSPTNVSSGFAPASLAGQVQAYDLRCVGEQDDVWVMYGLATGPGTTTGIPPLNEIRVAHSGDGGVSWDPAVALSEPGLKYLRPEIARSATGELVVIAYAGAQDGDPAGSMRWWQSADGGKSFSARGAFHAPISFTGDRQSQTWIGDYSGLLVSGGTVRTTFIDNSSGAAHVVFRSWGL
ncbi:MAG: exo-alpha-sialidase [Polyangiaceae bacterium]